MTKGIIIIVFILGIVSLSILMNAAANLLESQPAPPDRKFVVVDTYRGCSVVQYTPDYSARYTYFLDCKK